MSLRGTLGDFGIADIFQLIGHQAKTGVLHLRHREVEVHIFFVDGNVVKAEQSSRDKADLLGNIMVRAKVLKQAQLDEALAQQQRTQRRLGDLLVELNAVDRATLKEFARLQTTETIYRLFVWRAGTYEFSAEPVDDNDASYEPIRSENILMEGFRMVDEWPAVRRIIPSMQHTLTVIKQLPAATTESGADDDLLAGLDHALGGGGDDVGPPPRPVGEPERRAFALIRDEVTVAEIVDQSRLGEFETTKALATLVSNGFLRVQAPEAAKGPAVSVWRAALVDELKFLGARIAVGAASAALIGGVFVGARSVAGGAFDRAPAPSAAIGVTELVGEAQRTRLERALAVHAMERGRYPATLQELVDLGLIAERDVTGAYEGEFVYRVVDGRYLLAPPVR